VALSEVRDAARQERVRISTATTLREVRKNGELVGRATRLNPSIEQKLCVDCTSCVEACPVGCITRHGKGGLVQYSVDYGNCLLQKEGECSLCTDACPAGAISAGRKTTTLNFVADAILVATGHRSYDAARNVRLGYGRIPGVMTAAEVEEILGRQQALDPPARSIAFVQCVGSRDPREGRNYCSAVCCAYALRMAHVLRKSAPETDISIYYIDLQNFDKTFERFKRTLIQDGIRFVRAIPFRVEQSASGRLQVHVESPDHHETVVAHDKVILSTGMEPNEDASGLAALLQIPRNEFGFFDTVHPGSGRTARPEIFTCGTCHDPQGLAECMASARAVAMEMGRDP
jgi:heterodisulfide reductase subunit A